MQTTVTLKGDFDIPNEILQAFPLYLSVTHQLEDHQLVASLQNVFATTKNSSSNSQSECYCDLKVAYAVGVIFKVLLDQDTKLLDQLIQQATQSKDEKLIWAFQLLQFTIYQLYKTDTQLYLAMILNNKQIPKPQLNDEQVPLTASSIYSLVLMTEMHLFFQKIQLTQQLPYQRINDSSFNPNVEITLYQLTQAFPAIVLIKYNETELQQQIWNKHVAFLKDTGLQLLLDVLSDKKYRSNLVEKLKIQPYSVNSYQEFCQLLFVADQEKIQQMQTNQQCIKFFNENLQSKDPAANCVQIKNKITEQLIDINTNKQQNVKQNQEGQMGTQVQQAEEEIDVFKTQAPKSVSTTSVKRFKTQAR